MNSMRCRLAFRILLLAALATTACAGRSGSAQQTQVSVRVTNNLIPSTPVTVYLVPRSGIERELGMVFGSRTQTLTYRGLPLEGEYQLVARASSNRSMASSVLVLDNVAMIEWSLQNNFIQTTEREH